MAIINMKRLNMLAPKQDEHEILATLQRLQCVHITKEEATENFKKNNNTLNISLLEEEITRVKWAISKLTRFDTTKAPLLGAKPTITLKEASTILSSEKEALFNTIISLEELEQENGECRGKLARISAVKEQLLPWQAFTEKVSELITTKYTMATLATVRKDGLDELLQAGLPELCNIEILSTQRELAYILVLAHQDAVETLMQSLKEIGYVRVNLDVEETLQEKLAKLQKEENAILERQAEIESEIETYGKETQRLKLLYDCLATQKEQQLAVEDTLQSKSTFFLSGWVPETLVEKIEKTINKISTSTVLSFEDPKEGEEPPVLLHNNKAASPFETIVSGFALPSYTGFDPTAIMMPFFINFMGMMVSDAGYGLLMAILIPIIIKCLKPAPGTTKLMWVLAGGGVMTLVWGALYNTWFGFAPLPLLFDPVNNPMPVMGVCIALGAIHLFTGLGIAAYMNIRRGKVVDAIADQLSWALLIIGLGLLLVVPNVGKVIAILGVLIILVTSGRETTKNPIKRLLSGLGALYGATGWISDLLSYMRLFGMGLATGVIGMVINQLVAMVFTVPYVGFILGSIIFVGGHLFNAGINILGAYVHSCRLQYIEFFGKFYEDGGIPFAPLSATQRYCYITDSEKEA